MQKTNTLTLPVSLRKRSDFLPVLCFLLIAAVLFARNAFPALYGDEYGSLFEAGHLASNLHAIGYFFQLSIWGSILSSDPFLRLLSLVWFAASLYWLNRWLESEDIPDETRNLVIWLALLNPFLWFYGFQVRFYAMFLGASTLFIWRFRTWQKYPVSRNLFYLLLSLALLLTSHLFGVLVLAVAFILYAWLKLGNNRWAFGFLLVSIALLMFLPPVRLALVSIVYRMTANSVPVDIASRGISLGMLAKIPLTFYFFSLGERVYPLWWWFTGPAVVTIAMAFVLGLWQAYHLPILGSLTVLMLLNIPLMFLVLDPLAPPGLQGAAPRYLIFVVPYFLLLLGWGAQLWRPIKPVLIMTSVVGLYFLVVPSWSYGGSDFMDWPRYLREVMLSHQETCVITDGRAHGPVQRYIPAGTKMILSGEMAECLGYPRIVLASNDFRLWQVRHLDEMAKRLSQDYNLVSNATLFPAQITVYEKAPAQTFQFVPSRLDLPEQDIRFPVSVPERGWHIQGFVRLDAETPTQTRAFALNEVGHLWVLTNYRTGSPLEPGEPVFRVDLKSAGKEDIQILLRAAEETASWEGSCNSCKSMYEWTKLLHLLGTSTYLGAYRQYQAHVWGVPLDLTSQDIESVTISYLLPEGTGYFWGMYPE